ncbi:MAG: CotS family spore coat protein [Syntrophomonadaceae bacterium]|nr:CotS family spore coat protein [Syntrophomonadaceae bacterium]
MTKSLKDLAREVMAQYDFVPREIEVVQGSAPKAVWKICNGQDSRCLKRLRPKKKLEFTTGAQYYLSTKGAKVPALYKTLDDSLVAIHDGEVFALYAWIEGRTYGMNNENGLRFGMQGLAEFHRDSTGYEPVAGVVVSSKLGRWPEQYQTIYERLLAWENQARSNSSYASLSRFSREVGGFITLVEESLIQLEKSGYHDWVKESQSSRSLCHQDYGEGNFVVTDGGVYVLDLDDVTFDLPARDLRKIVNKVMSARGAWNREILDWILDYYQQFNPLTPEQRRVLFIDLLFPHVFHDTFKNAFRKGQPAKLSKLSAVVKLEQSKLKIIRQLLQIE